jgi:hypothetical protein
MVIIKGHPNIKILESAIQKLGPLVDEMVFWGGPQKSMARVPIDTGRVIYTLNGYKLRFPLAPSPIGRGLG